MRLFSFFYGGGCKTAQAELKNLVRVTRNFSRNKGPTAVSYYTCERTLSSIHRLTAKLETVKANIKNKLSALQSVIHCGEKRPRPISDKNFEELPSTKQPHTEKTDSAPASSASTNHPESGIVVSAQTTPLRKSQSPLQSTTATVEPAVKVPSPQNTG